jgi:hypothetical protein
VTWDRLWEIEGAQSEIDLWWGDKVSRVEGEALYMRIRRVYEIVGGDMEVCVAEAHRYAQVVYNPVVTSGECPFCKVLAKVAHSVNNSEHALDGVAAVQLCSVEHDMRKLLEEPT